MGGGASANKQQSAGAAGIEAAVQASDESELKAALGGLDAEAKAKLLAALTAASAPDPDEAAKQACLEALNMQADAGEEAKQECLAALWLQRQTCLGAENMSWWAYANARTVGPCSRIRAQRPGSSRRERAVEAPPRCPPGGAVACRARGRAVGAAGLLRRGRARAGGVPRRAARGGATAGGAAAELPQPAKATLGMHPCKIGYSFGFFADARCAAGCSLLRQKGAREWSSGSTQRRKCGRCFSPE
ncbi:unnamed protein product [Prorocentrum cordatum]|uniref:Uncharacterized protein n=1 Tax=Prorocentrum cordatum TaxID=2364126 RepID=A0ABN9SP80_9DINO|nr:unnamed protein product [Polarella glacialis]